MSENKYKGKTLNFWQLLNDHKIEIPIIQRDYAQGRKDKKEILDNFLNALYQSLISEKEIKLDFIYGSNEDKAFQPLDGQQRLTTLFLLHWYAYKKERISDHNSATLLEKFSYETRITSREFCKAIVTNTIDFTLDIESLSSLLIDSSWFFLSWKKDPTIEAMLRTIDDIHKKFRDIDNLWSKLTSSESLISFYHVELENIGLTDDLYIKMNARGKLLSPFENFKASFQKYINDKNWEDGVQFTDSFACLIDTRWTDLFWQHRKENTIDEAFMRFISAIAMIRQSIERSDDRITNIERFQQNPNHVRVDSFSKAGFQYLCMCFNIFSALSDGAHDLTLDFPLWQHSTKDIFSALVYDDNLSSAIRNSASYTQKVLFYAQIEYLRQAQTFEREKYLEWMRVVRNIISRGDITKTGDRPAIIRSPQTFDGVINLISELGEGCLDIYKYLSEKENFKSSFARQQIDEERLKSKIITKFPAYKQGIFATEDTNLLQGRIDFALFCIDYDKEKNNFDYDNLIKVHSVLTKYFENDITNDFRRAMLTIEVNGKYKFYEYWWSFWNVLGAQKRCLIDKYRELEYYIYGNYKNRDEYKNYFKNLVNKLTEEDMEDVINNFIPPDKMPNWQIRLIKEPHLLDNNCKSHYIAIPEDESCCYLLKSMRPRDLDGCEKIE
ncbi:DUF262 domain-containing protein [Flavobacterium lindanitolerans]|uniref:DUF262 domain-containing protein n=1 Tax=Flavobacterium lindanitolerans TaxID=428988 RepID=UPI0027B8CBF9|nr:DUF262 domain-containing protein [Flavobacterium lindanitolerans]